jgi:hypothetical protein
MILEEILYIARIGTGRVVPTVNKYRERACPPPKPPQNPRTEKRLCPGRSGKSVSSGDIPPDT